MFTIIIIIHVLFWLLYQWFFSMALACWGVQQPNLGIGQTEERHWRIKSTRNGRKWGLYPWVLKCGKGQSKHVHVYIIVYIYIYGYNVFHRPHPVFSSTIYIYICARFRDVVLCMFHSSCARFTEVVHVSQKLYTFHKPPNNVRVQLYTHWAHSNQQKHWGDQTRSPDIIYIYI